MSMFSEIAAEGTIKAIVGALKNLYDAEQDPAAKDAYRKAMIECFRHFDWDTPDWAREMRTQLTPPFPPNREIREGDIPKR